MAGIIKKYGTEGSENMARPKIYDAQDIAEKLNAYIFSSDDPLLAEFCLPVDQPCEDTIYRLAKENDELSEALKRLVKKQQVYLCRAGKQGSIPFQLAIFRLKQPQHNFRDNFTVDTTARIVYELPSQILSLTGDE